VAAGKASWLAHRPARYRMTVRRSCFCPPDTTDPVTIEVDGTEITSPTGTTGLTVDDIYDEASRTGSQGRITGIQIDPTWGFPAFLNIDHIINAVDDEMAYTITDFQAL
jgi:hypothetical protein